VSARRPRPDQKQIKDAREKLAKLEAAPALERVDELVALLDSPSWPVRRGAADVLAKLGSRVVGPIRDRFPTLTEHQRYWAMRVIARVMGAGAMSWLAGLFRTPNPAVRGSILSAVAEIPGDEAIEFMFQALNDEAWPIRYAAAEHLERRGKAILPQLARGVKEGAGDSKYWSLRLLVRVLQQDGVVLLTQCMENEDQTLRYYTIRALGESSDEWALRMLVKALSDPSWPNRQLASHTLATKGKAAVTVLLDALKTDDLDVLYWVLRSLGEIGDERLITPAMRVVARSDLDPEAHEWVADAIAGVRSDAAAKRLVELAAQEEPLRARILDHLKKFGAIGVRPLLRYVKSTNTAARDFAAGVLRSLAYPNIDKLIAGYEALNPTSAELLLQSMKVFDAAMLEEILKKGSATVERLQELSAGFANDGPSDASSVIRMPLSIAGSVVGMKRPDSVVDVPYPVTFDELLGRALEQSASDIHLRVGRPPVMRVQGFLKNIQLPVLTDGHVRGLIRPVLGPVHEKTFAREKELDLGYEIPGVSRFRVNVFSELSGTGVVARVIPSRVPSLTDLALPAVFQTICGLFEGLVLVTGPTGSGKSTTLAAMIDHINETRDEHILTIEDPVEFRHSQKRALMSYRELGKNTKSFSKALRSALREDPDVVLVGELRDRTTIQLALRAAETGHLVFGTLHTSTAAETVDRIVNVFSATQQSAVRTSLSTSLKAVICQHLVPTIDRKRVPALEILLVNFAAQNLIREHKLNQLESVIISGRKEGMVGRDEYLANLVRTRKITPDTAMEYAHNKQELDKLLRKV
jgi:twitching motility protein PilT